MCAKKINMMKKILLFLGIAITFASCSLDDGEDTTYFQELVPVVSVETPDSLVYGKIDTLQITFKKPSTCHRFIGFQTEKKEDTVYVGLVAGGYVQQTCDSLINKTEVVDLKFEVKDEANYYFKFWEGTDEEGKSVFSEVYIIPVKKE